MSRIFKVLFLVFLLFLFVLGVLFHVRNSAPVPLDVYVLEIEWPVSWIAIGAFSVGALIGWFAGALQSLSLRRRLRSATRARRGAEAALAGVRGSIESDAG